MTEVAVAMRRHRELRSEAGRGRPQTPDRQAPWGVAVRVGDPHAPWGWLGLGGWAPGGRSRSSVSLLWTGAGAPSL